MTYIKKKKLVLLYGGCSGEHEISLLSAASVLNALESHQYEVTCIAGDKEGHWYKTAANTLLPLSQNAPLAIKNSTSEKIHLSTEHFKDIYAVLPIIHGPLFEDGRLQGFLDLCQVAYLGSGHMSSAIAMDKDMAKVIAQHHGVNIAPYHVIKKDMPADKRLEIIEKAIKTLHFPLFVKPACMGSSVGINKCTSRGSVLSAIEEAFHYDHKILIEQGIKGREIEIAILKQKEVIKVSQAGEIKITSKNDFYSYQAKYQSQDMAELIFPATLSKKQLNSLQKAAELTFESLECEGLARVDFFLEDETDRVILNEINTLPGFTQISMYPKLWAISGISYPTLLNMLIDQAHWHHQKNSLLLRNYL